MGTSQKDGQSKAALFQQAQVMGVSDLQIILG